MQWMRSFVPGIASVVRPWWRSSFALPPHQAVISLPDPGPFPEQSIFMAG